MLGHMIHPIDFDTVSDLVQLEEISVKTMQSNLHIFSPLTILLNEHRYVTNSDSRKYSSLILRINYMREIEMNTLETFC